MHQAGAKSEEGLSAIESINMLTEHPRSGICKSLWLDR